MLHTAGGHFGSGDVFVASGYGVDSRASVAESSRFIGDLDSPLNVPWIVVLCSWTMKRSIISDAWLEEIHGEIILSRCTRLYGWSNRTGP